ncbi:MAG: glycosyltransferase [Lachnospiraceae bacterium]|nr:glycosyltransferase [Lachnospiraceae bacterium]
MKEFISIIVPVFNTAPYLERCITSLLSQTYPQIEIILVNDGSSDESGAVCDDYAQKDKRILVIHQENKGPMAACRAGITKSRGKYLCFVDSDDAVMPEMIEAMAAHLSNRLREIICCNIIVERATGTFREPMGLRPGVYEGDRLREVFKNILGNENRQISLSRCMKLISRELITDNLDDCDDSLLMGEDAVMMLMALLDSQRIVIMAEAYFYHYYLNKDSLVHGYRDNLYKDISRKGNHFHRIMSDKTSLHGLNISAEEIKAQCLRENLFSLMLLLKYEARGNPNAKLFRKRIKAICEAEQTKALCRKYPVKAQRKANKLLFLVLKYPNVPMIVFLRLVSKLFYRFIG